MVSERRVWPVVLPHYLWFSIAPLHERRSKVGNPLRLLSDCHLMRVQVFPELQHQYKALWPSKQGTNPNESKEWESLITRLRSVEKALISTYAKAKLTSSQAVLQKWLK